MEVEAEETDEELFALRVSSAAFDELVSATLEKERADLTEIAEQLASHGMAAITRPSGVVNAKIHRRRFGTPIIEMTSERRDGATQRARHLLRQEEAQGDDSDVVLALAFAVAWLQEVSPS